MTKAGKIMMVTSVRAWCRLISLILLATVVMGFSSCVPTKGETTTFGSNPPGTSPTSSGTTSTKTFINPTVKTMVTLPTNVQASPTVKYPITFRLTNGEDVDLVVTWIAHSAVAGDFDNGTVTIPKNGFVEVTRSYIFNVPGHALITYNISYNGTSVSGYSGSINVLA